MASADHYFTPIPASDTGPTQPLTVTSFSPGHGPELGSSLLDFVDTKMARMGGRASITRMLLAATKSPNVSAESVIKFHQGVFEAIALEDGDEEGQGGNNNNNEESNSNKRSPVTGLLVVQGESVLHMIETSLDTNTSFLRALQTALGRGAEGGCGMEEVRVLTSSEDCATPYFHHWHHHELTLSPETVEKEDPTDAAWRVMDKLGELAEEMVHHAGHMSSSTLQRKHGHLVACNELVRTLATSDEYMSVTEFMDMFDTPVDVCQEAEVVWPAPQIL